MVVIRFFKDNFNIYIFYFLVFIDFNFIGRGCRELFCKLDLLGFDFFYF